MDFEEFVNVVKARIREFLPDDYANASVEVTETRKLNHSYPALIIRQEGQEIAPSIDLGELYKELENSSMDEVLVLAASLAERRPDGIDLSQLNDYETAKERLIIRISNADGNRSLLNDVPHKEVNGLAITYHLLISMDGGEMGSAIITNKIMEMFGITQEQLHEDAVNNSPKILPPSVEPMENMLGKMMGFGLFEETPAVFAEQVEELDLQRDGMAVLTNTQAVNGAAVIFYPDVMRQIGDSQNVDMFILPSSTHEVILVPDNGSVKLRDLEEMVKSINESAVEPKDRLSDTVYHYDHKEHLLEKGSDFESRVKGDIADAAEEVKAKHKKEKDWER